MDIPGVPESVDWTEVRDFLARLGIDPHRVLAADGVTIGWNFITCSVKVLDENGNCILTDDRTSIVTHQVSIPIHRPADRGHLVAVGHGSTSARMDEYRRSGQYDRDMKTLFAPTDTED